MTAQVRPAPRPISRVVSPSKSDALESCPHRYWQQQCNPEPDTREQQIGKAFHEFMPVYIAACLLAGRQQMPEVVDECIRQVGSAAEWAPDLRDEITALARCTARDFLIPAGAQCFTRTATVTPFEFGWGVRAAADGSPEACTYDYPAAVIHGRYDWPFGIAGTSIIWICDWKTGRFDPEEIPVDRGRVPKQRQPRWYLFGASICFPGAERFAWSTFHPRTGKTLTATCSRQQLHRGGLIWSEIRAAHAELQSRMDADAAGEYEKAWAATPCKWCETCQFGPQKGNDTCPHYNQQQRGVSELRTKLEARRRRADEPESHSELTSATTTNANTETSSTVTEQDAATLQPESNESAAAPLPAAIPADWQLSDDGAESPRFKIFIYGDKGTYKTRSILAAFADRKPNAIANKHAARLAVIDTENGTEHYQHEFRFLRKVTTKKENIVDGVLNPPPGVETIAIDSFTDFCDLVTEHWKTIYLVRERGAGNKRDYYTLQPRDYQNITEEIRKMVRALIDRADLNVIVTAKPKAQYAEGEMMRQTGETFDGFKRMPFFMDVILHLTKGADGVVTAETERDRTNRFPQGRWVFTPEEFARVVEAARSRTPQTPLRIIETGGSAPVQPIHDAEAVRVGLFNQIRELKTARRVSDEDYKSMLAELFAGAESARLLDEAQLRVLIQELDALPPF